MDTSFDEVKDSKEEETGAWYKKWCKPLMLGLLLAPVVVFLFLGPWFIKFHLPDLHHQKEFAGNQTVLHICGLSERCINDLRFPLRSLAIDYDNLKLTTGITVSLFTLIILVLIGVIDKQQINVTELCDKMVELEQTIAEVSKAVESINRNFRSQ